MVVVGVMLVVAAPIAVAVLVTAGAVDAVQAEAQAAAQAVEAKQAAAEAARITRARGAVEVKKFQFQLGERNKVEWFFAFLRCFFWVPAQLLSILRLRNH